ncbi:HU family DNA-binding protein [Tropheryma whipplei]|uniref:DNA-binding protein HU n=1 Tax=Tropheryma whipplei (strain Twist) TaxID=203267 RepID=Q83GW5_TROWT|nr:HU family DNA-binding protein [Tropheryma whipplei]AAO44213.1 DNA-binding protein HU [Tropheryma whipplei str. Twist]MCO8182866.1 HU family DNA-binding protein [Tropheryma whipplei]MCO8190424.1 HU family DNA-binding protein [Tropheryma whipplei]CAD66808.1 DNA-binding protein HU-alpha [Tropheryma whipplei TW08/27]
MVSLNRTELVAKVAETSGVSRATVNSVIEETFAVFAETVRAGGKVTIPGWCSVTRSHRAARTGRNPQTGKTVEIPAGYSVRIAPGSKLKAAVK